MILRNSMKNIFRSWGKTILFFLLIMTLTIILSLGLSVWMSINQFLDECNTNYSTTGVFEYMGPEYPDESVYDEGLQRVAREIDFSAISENENVVLPDRDFRSLGYIEGFSRTDAYVPHSQAAVIIISEIGFFNYYKLNTAVIEKTLYSKKDQTGRMILIDSLGGELEEGHTYIVHGEFVYGKTSYIYFKPTPYVNAAASSVGFTDGDKYMITDITGKEDEYDIDKETIYNQIARTYNVINNSVTIFATEDLKSIMPFHQQQLYIKEGRDFLKEEYEQNAFVCVVQDIIAQSLGINVGDEIVLNFSITPKTPVYESYWDSTGFSNKDIYKVVGISNSTADMRNAVYIPNRDDLDFSVNQIGYTIGRVVLDNEGADEFYKDIESLLPNRVRLTIYDQGYSSVVEPFKRVMRIAIIITLACILVSIAVIALFGFLFVYRQRDVADTMIKLGTGRPGIIRYFLYGSGAVSLFAAGIGSLAGYYLLGLVANIISNNALKFAISDTRYSIGKLSIQKASEWVLKINFSVFIWIGFSVLFAALFSCFIFTLMAIAKKNKKRRKTKTKILKRTGHSFISLKGSFKYSFLSIIRGGQRSIIAPAVSLAVVIFLSQLATTVEKYERQLDEIYKNTEIKAQFTDLRGKYFNRLGVEAHQLNELARSGYIKDLSMSKELSYMYLGKSLIDGEIQFIEPLVIPKEFAGETLMDKIRRGPSVIFANSLQNSPEFYYSSIMQTEYLDGYDESFLGQETDETYLIMVSTDFMEQNDVKLGDTIRLFVLFKKNAEIDALVVGSYVKEGKKDNIYCQLDSFYDIGLLTDPSEEAKEKNFKYTFDSANFVVSDSSKLALLKSFLSDYGFSEINNIKKIRSYMLFDDKVFNSTLDSLMQKIRHADTLYPFLYTLVGIAAVLLSYLLILSRKKEIAIMRGLGARKSRIFMSFFIEQMLLCLLGCLAGLAGWAAFAGSLSSFLLILATGFVLCYFIGVSTALIVMNRIIVLSILNDEE